jgi:tetratricopeptide (TPR) repeat protein
LRHRQFLLMRPQISTAIRIPKPPQLIKYYDWMRKSTLVDIAFMIKSPSVEKLHGLGNRLYVSGRATEAIESFDSALLMMQAGDRLKLNHLPRKTKKSFLTHPYQDLNLHLQSLDSNSHSDSFFEGECDVGPRPILFPLHIDYNTDVSINPSIIISVLLYNKGLAHHSEGNHESASDSYGRALTAISQVTTGNNVLSKSLFSGISHIGSLIHNNLGYIAYHEGDEHSALCHFENSLSLCKQVTQFIDEKEWTLTVATIASNFARTQWMFGDLRSQTLSSLLLEILRLRSLWLPTNHSDVLCCHLNLGLFFFHQNDKNKAKEHLWEYMKHAPRDGSCMGPTHALSFLLIIEHECERDENSKEIVRTLWDLITSREDLGDVTVESATHLNYLGSLLFRRRQYEGALLFYMHELDVEKKLQDNIGEIDITVTYNNIARILQELDRFEEAIVYYQKALQSDKSGTFSSDEKAVRFLLDVTPSFNEKESRYYLNLYSTIWYNLGIIRARSTLVSEALTAFRISLKLREFYCGKIHPDVACLWYNIGNLQLDCNEFREASISFQTALSIRKSCAQDKENTHGDEDYQLIFTKLFKVAEMQTNSGKLEEAISSYEAILQHQDEEFWATKDIQNNQRSCIRTILQISELRYAQGNVDFALQLAQQALLRCTLVGDISFRNFHGDLSDALMISNLLMWIGCLHHEKCEVSSACVAFRTAYDLLTTSHSKERKTLSQLEPWIEVLSMLQNQTCAPQA